MDCAILTIGDELLSGRISDINSSHITRRLETVGIETAFHISVGDDLEHIARALRLALAECRVVIITGGLGPTRDDLTREAVAAALGRELVYSEEIAEHIRQRFEFMRREMAESNLRQAYMIEGSRVIEPVMGTAPGLVIDAPGGRVIAMMPGVPAEMREMLERAVLPALEGMGETGTVRLQRVFRVLGGTESEIAERVEKALAGMDGLKLAYLASFSGIEVRVTASAATEAEAAETLDMAEERLREELSLLIACMDGETIESVIGDLLRERGLTISLAESCTGGMVGEMLTRVPGSSDYFLGGVISYANDPKHEMLGVSRDILEEKGAVSREAAAAMAQGARRVFGSDLAISITGIAGPGGGTPEKPVGTVFIGLSGKNISAVRELILPLGREAVRCISATLSLALLRVYLLGGDFERFGG